MTNVVLPDGSAASFASFPLPKDHWLYETNENGYAGPPPMSFRMAAGDERTAMENRICLAARWAIKASTLCGQDEDFDPDAMVQNMIVGMLGFYTTDGLSGESFDTPDPLPALHRWRVDD